MDALVVRLSQLDAQAAGALRVVMFYDTLMRRRVDLPALARATANLAECVAGIRLHGTGQVIRFAPDGRETSTPLAPASATEPVTLDPDDLETLDTYCATGSLRRAADVLHLHHSSVSRRLEQIGKAMGVDLTEPTGLTRARVALTTWRLLGST